MACSRTSFFAWAALPTNQPRSRPCGSGSQAPVKCQPLSQISTQVWLPDLFAHSGVPTRRAGTATLRHASLSRIDSPVHDALPCAIDSLGLWCGFLRPVEYFTFSLGKTVRLSCCAASLGVLHSLIIGMHSSYISLRHGSRDSSTFA